MDDVIGEAHLALVEMAGRYDSTRNVEFWPFARQRVRGAILNAFYRRSIDQPLQETLFSVEPTERRIDAGRLLDHMRERERRMVQLRMERGLAYQQIADQFGLTRQGAQQAIRRAIYRVKRQLTLEMSQ